MILATLPNRRVRLGVVGLAIATLLVIAILRHAHVFEQSTASSIRAVHYWGGCYPKNFWNCFDPNALDRDFVRIRADGFNAIVLAVSWTEFEPRLTPTPVFDERSFALLQDLVRKARAHDLDVILRVGFIWSFRPDAQLPNAERVDAAFVDDSVRNAWLAFVGEVCRRVCDEPNLRFGFLSWEDLFPFNIAAAGANITHLGFRRQFVEYLRRDHALPELDALLGEHVASWDEASVPDRRSAAYGVVLDYWDDALIYRFWLPARKLFPRLSFEVRVDKDPVWNGEAITWHGHDALFRVPGVDPAVIYYAVAWGMRNQGDEVDAGPALAALEHLLVSATRNSGSPALFIDQFNFFDNTPEFSHNTRLHESQLDAMLAGSAALFAKYHAGYALWSDHDYAASIVYNPSFQAGLDGWTATSGVAPQHATDGRLEVRMEPGTSITQSIESVNREPGFVAGAPGVLCFSARSLATSGARLRVAGLAPLPTELSLTLAGAAAKRCLDVVLAPRFRLEFSALQGAVALTDIELYTHQQRSRMYHADGSAGPQLAAIRALNAELARR